jgi:hypothetical protein
LIFVKLDALETWTMKKCLLVAALSAMFLPLNAVQAGVVYSDPDGGWTYVYGGEEIANDTFASLDGTWDHENGSDAWDGSGIGQAGSAPGGITAITEGGVTFARFQDVGNPLDNGFSDPSNRKIYLTHDITDSDPDGELLNTGVTLTFRTRLATSGLLDGNVPAGGDGYYIRDGGKGNFSIRSPFVRDGQGAVVSFALSTANGDDLADNSTGALLMNNFDPALNVDVDTLGGGDRNEFPVSDPTAWNEFWVTISEGDEFNLYNVNVYANGSTTPTSFVVSGGNGNDGAFGSYLGIGVHSTPQSGVIDVDFFGFKPGIHVPSSAVGTPGDFNGDGTLDASDIDALAAAIRSGSSDAQYDVNGDGAINAADHQSWVVDLKNTYIGDANLDGEFNSGDFVAVFTVGEYEDATSGNSTWAEGDWNGDADFNSGDFVLAFQAGGYEQGPRGAVASVPEPSSWLLLAIGGLIAIRRR